MQSLQKKGNPMGERSHLLPLWENYPAPALHTFLCSDLLCVTPHISSISFYVYAGEGNFPLPFFPVCLYDKGLLTL